MTEPILKLEGLKKYFESTSGGIFNKKKGIVKAVDGIDLEIMPGETVGLVAARPRWAVPSSNCTNQLKERLLSMARTSLICLPMK
jgi:hypothetical protein